MDLNKVYNESSKDFEEFRKINNSRLAKEIHDGGWSVFNLPIWLYNGFTNILSSPLNILKPKHSESLLSPLQDNIYMFSAAKTFQEVLTLNSLRVNEKKQLRTFSEFKKLATPILDEFNVRHLRTEYNLSVNTIISAQQWQDIVEDEDVLPLLEYRTVRDDRVRDNHKVIDRIIKPVNDPFWDTYYPPNGYGCRCDVIQKSTGIITPDNNIVPPIIPDELKINSGKDKIIFSSKHPHFEVDETYKRWAERNFGLALPE